jgi:DNA (cytosine-5)-methyltransferase 1
MRNGAAYAQPTWERRTADSGYSSSPSDDDEPGLLDTPSARMYKGAGPAGGPTHHRNSARGLIEAQVLDLLPTPVAQPSGNTPEEHLRKKPGRVVVTDLAIIAENGLLETGGRLLPTPAAMDGSGGRVSSEMGGQRESGAKRSVTLATAVHHSLLPTPRTSDTNGPGRHGTGGPDLRTVASELLPTPRATRGGSGTETMYSLGAERSDDNRPQGEVLLPAETNWGPYEPAIRRWEAVLGRPAPAPTELSDVYLKMIARRKAGKDKRPVGMRGSIRPVHRLSPAFTEWMMGVPKAWICDVEISRNDKLKAAGNGVVPQQAAAALRDMLATFRSEATA